MRRNLTVKNCLALLLSLLFLTYTIEGGSSEFCIPEKMSLNPNIVGR